MGSETEPEHIAGESWLDFLARRRIPRDKVEPIHEIQWLRGERIRWMAEAERHRMTEKEMKAADAASLRALKACADEVWQPLLRYLDRTAPKEVGRE